MGRIRTATCTLPSFLGVGGSNGRTREASMLPSIESSSESPVRCEGVNGVAGGLRLRGGDIRRCMGQIG